MHKLESLVQRTQRTRSKRARESKIRGNATPRATHTHAQNRARHGCGGCGGCGGAAAVMTVAAVSTAAALPMPKKMKSCSPLVVAPEGTGCEEAIWPAADHMQARRVVMSDACGA